MNTSTIQHAVGPLVDCSMGMGGYRERLTDSVVAAPTAIVEALRRHGVGAIHSTSSTWEEYWALCQIAAESDGPIVSGGGAAVTDELPASHRLRWIRSQDDIRRAVATTRSEDRAWITVQSSSRDFVQAVATEAQKNDVRVALRGSGDCADSLAEGDMFLGFVRLLSRSAVSHPLDTLVGWESPDGVQRARQLSQKLGERGVGITTELVSHRRSVFIREGLNTPFLETLEPILPHTRHIREMNRTGGYLAGKRELKKSTGLAEPNRQMAKRAQAGWNGVLEVCEATHQSVRLLPGSRAPQITTVPGYSFKEELAMLAHLGCSLDYVLYSATEGARTFLDIPEDAEQRLISDETGQDDDPTRLLLSLRVATSQ